ncbi:MAG: hypothetical protein R3277_09585 [Brumimicrobium sp.]|nr:hypothetical protein [Brumimicrobium sp.]
MILIIDCGYKYINRLENLVYAYDDFQTVSVMDVLAQDMEEKQGLIITGTQISVHETNVDHYIEKFRIFLDSDLPILATGVGHHFVGISFGALTAYQPYVNDLVEMSLLEDDPLFAKLPSEINMMEDHAGTISIPADFQLLASSDLSINEAMRHKTKNIYGIQFLPELSGNQGAIVIENFVDISHNHKR